VHVLTRIPALAERERAERHRHQDGRNHQREAVTPVLCPHVKGFPLGMNSGFTSIMAGRF
jgi:hypothetical protein